MKQTCNYQNPNKKIIKLLVSLKENKLILFLINLLKMKFLIA